MWEAMQQKQGYGMEKESLKGAPTSLHMRGGTGSGSYNEFSASLQTNLNEFYRPKLSHAIASTCSKLRSQCFVKHDDAGAARFAIADFGCSCAWSTVGCMYFMTQCVVDELASSSAAQISSDAAPQIHIQAFFNDLPGNDFNTLFALLSSSSSSQPNAPSYGAPGLENFVPCGLPGSFYSRLFPSSYLHIGLCTLALHNLSMVPEAVQDRNSSAWNENGIWIVDGCKPETASEYKKQFEKDFTCFLRHRSQELVPGGLLFCVMIASQSKKGLPTNKLYENLQSAWRQLVSEGLLSQESLDTFNLPLFTPTEDEVKEVVGMLHHREFEVIELEQVEVERAPAQVWKECAAANAQAWGSTCETMVRNFVGSLIQPHLGAANFEVLMERLREVASTDDEVYWTSRLQIIVLALSRR